MSDFKSNKETENKPRKPRRRRKELLGEETALYKEEKERLKDQDLSDEEVRASAERLLEAFKDLLDASKIAMKTSDKLTFNLNANYSELLEDSRALADKLSKVENSFLGRILIKKQTKKK